MHKRFARTTVRVVLLAAVSAVALLTASAASAANIAPNPGFETDCPPQPCSWPQNAGTVTRDTAQKHSGVASIKLVPPSTSGAGSQSTSQAPCVNAALPAGSLPLGYWYRSTTGISGVALIVNAYSVAGCGSGELGQFMLQPGSVNTSGNWIRVSGAVTLPAAAASVRITLSTGCTNPGCNGTPATNFDDIAVGEAPTTAVTLSSLRAARTPHGVRVTWKVANARDVAGFNVYRGQQKLNRSLVASRGGLGSATYTWFDRTAKSGRLSYRIQAVKLDGTRAWLGTATVRD